MISSSDTRRDSMMRTYDRFKSVVFLKTNEEFGGLSNMAGGFPLVVNRLSIFTSEALYQACRFPHMPEVQRLIIAQTSPMTAKMKSKPHRRDSRPDWNQVRVKIMRWCLRVKLVQHWNKFSELLLATGDRPIVEHSRRDDFWGAKPAGDQTLVGVNVLGRLLMELREEVRSGSCTALMRVEPLLIPDFLLNGLPIQPIVGKRTGESRESVQMPEQGVPVSGSGPMAEQIAMFEQLSPSIQAVRQGQRERRAQIRNLKPHPSPERK
jgi:type I restriction enzyme, S subunit